MPRFVKLPGVTSMVNPDHVSRIYYEGSSSYSPAFIGVELCNGTTIALKQMRVEELVDIESLFTEPR